MKLATAILTVTLSLFSLLPTSVTAEEEAARLPQNAVSQLETAKGLEATLFVAEPELLSPTNIDVDARGRVWVCEVVNYRGRNGERKEGDRILIFEDEDGDGRADSKKVFYQGRDIDSAVGICVLGNKVIVSVSPNVFVFTDEDGDDKADKKETLFSNTGQPQHDHSAHAFTFGPDGKLYWNFGNTGKHVHDAEGKPVLSQEGHPVVDNRKPYIGGMVFRCNMDGSEFEVVGHNFRNNYEVTVDSFGSIWQSDNDDDGNQGVRINYVMEYGNYGYRDEFTGAGWRTPRVGMNPEIRLRHWHLEDPGVVPNLLQTGGGSPTGICVYEGRLLPKVFWDQIIHTDAGPNIVRAYPVENDGAGYKARIENILDGKRDQWFRPSDVCVAPDGSLIVADWYDPGVGGHRMGDATRGRLFRIAPPAIPYHMTKFDVSTPQGAINALKSPNRSRRYLGWTALNQMQKTAEPLLVKMSKTRNPRYRARAYWLLALIEGRGKKTVQEMVQEENSDLRIQALRVARRLKLDLVPVIEQLVNDPSPQVRRECAVTLREVKSSEKAALWAKLAAQHDGEDRWYLEALGIGAAHDWDHCLEAWLKIVGENWNTKAGRDVLWRSRAKVSAEYIVKLIRDPQTTEESVPRYLRAFDFLPVADKEKSLEELSLHTDLTSPTERTKLIVGESLIRLPTFDLAKNPEKKKRLYQVLDHLKGTQTFVKMISQHGITDKNEELLALAQSTPDAPASIEAMRLLLVSKQIKTVREGLHQNDKMAVENVMRAIGNTGRGDATNLLIQYMENTENDLGLRRMATRQLGRNRYSSQQLLKLVEEKKLRKELKETAAVALFSASDAKVRSEAAKWFPQAPSRNNKPLPPIRELAKKKGNVSKGRLVYNGTGTCIKCHQIFGFGKEIGPSLTEIGSKLTREAMYEAILFPSAGISHNYEAYTVVDEDGNIYSGLLTSKTDSEIVLKTIEGISQTFKTENVDELIKQSISLMPADLQKIMTEEELVNLVEYLTTLKKEEK